MKKTLWVLALLATLSIGCKKDDPIPLLTVGKTFVEDYWHPDSTGPFYPDSYLQAGGLIMSLGNSPITSAGVCWGTKMSPTTGDNVSLYSSGCINQVCFDLSNFLKSDPRIKAVLRGLAPSTLYYVRAFATNSAGTAYANEVSFSTFAGVVDIEGSFYNTVAIGTQVWLKENLRTATYSNGNLIPTGVDWGNVTTGAWSYPFDNISFNNPYGKLYNWYAVTDSRKLCPNGYRVPSDIEWTTLENFLGGSSIAGGKLKEAGTIHWSEPNTGADNSSGFTGLPAGNRRGAVNSVYEVFGTMGRHWTSTQVDADAALGRDLVHDGTQVVGGLTNQFNKKYGFSVRCIKE